MHMMALGMFLFGLPTVAYQSMQQQLAWRHPSNSRIGVRPASQSLGADDETITLAGTVYPEISYRGIVSIDDLRAMGDAGDAYLLIDGTGIVHGQFVITSLSTTRTEFFPDGATRKIEVSLALKRVDDKTDAIISTADGGR